MIIVVSFGLNLTTITFGQNSFDKQSYYSVSVD